MSFFERDEYAKKDLGSGECITSGAMTAENRKGVPQGRHAHVLLAQGAQILDELFPGLLDDLAAGGAPVIRDQARRARTPPTPSSSSWRSRCSELPP